MLEKLILGGGVVLAIGAAIWWSEDNRGALREEVQTLSAQLEAKEWEVVQARDARAIALKEAARSAEVAASLRADMEEILLKGLGNEELDPALRDILNRRMRGEDRDGPGVAGGGSGVVDSVPR